MTVNRDCLNEAALVDYLYDECAPRDRAAMSAHLALCTRCADELEALRQTRVGLAAWTPPAAELGFRIVAGTEQSTLQPVAAVPPGWWTRPLPAWAQTAAAAVIFATGLGLGAMRGSTTAESPGIASQQELAKVEQRLRTEMQQLAPRLASTHVAPALAPDPAPAAPTTALTLQQVRTLIAESEQRQQRELALRTAEVIRDFDTQRRGDLARIEQTFGQIEGRTGAAEAQQQQLLNMIRRVSQ